MKRLIKMARTIGFIMFIIIAAAAGGLGGAYIPNREKFQNNEVRIEMIDRKQEEAEEEGEIKD